MAIMPVYSNTNSILYIHTAQVVRKCVCIYFALHISSSYPVITPPIPLHCTHIVCMCYTHVYMLSTNLKPGPFQSRPTAEKRAKMAVKQAKTADRLDLV